MPQIDADDLEIGKMYFIHRRDGSSYEAMYWKRKRSDEGRSIFIFKDKKGEHMYYRKDFKAYRAGPGELPISFRPKPRYTGVLGLGANPRQEVRRSPKLYIAPPGGRGAPAGGAGFGGELRRAPAGGAGFGGELRRAPAGGAGFGGELRVAHVYGNHGVGRVTLLPGEGEDESEDESESEEDTVPSEEKEPLVKEFPILGLQVFDYIPPEDIMIESGVRSIPETDRVAFRKEAVTNNELKQAVRYADPPPPISLSLQIQQNIRHRTGSDLRLPAAESGIKLGLPVARVEGRDCGGCLESETDDRRLYKVHLDHADEPEAMLCKECLLGHIHTPLDVPGTYKCFFTYIAAQPATPTAPATPEKGCKRILTDYQLSCVFEDPHDFTIQSGVNADGSPRMILTKDAFYEKINAAREAQEAARHSIREREIAERAAREQRERNAQTANLETRMRRVLANRESAKVAAAATAAGGNISILNFSPLQNFSECAGEGKSLCPYCYTFGTDVPGCNTVDHNGRPCPAGLPVDQARRDFPWKSGIAEWCGICGRAHTHHAHYPLRGGLEYQYDFGETRAAMGEGACFRQGGGGRVEYIVRVLALRDELIESVKRYEFTMNLELRKRIYRRTMDYLGPQPNVRRGEPNPCRGEQYDRARRLMENNAGYAVRNREIKAENDRIEAFNNQAGVAPRPLVPYLSFWEDRDMFPTMGQLLSGMRAANGSRISENIVARATAAVLPGAEAVLPAPAGGAAEAEISFMMGLNQYLNQAFSFVVDPIKRCFRGRRGGARTRRPHNSKKQRTLKRRHTIKRSRPILRKTKNRK